jgi:hypothetical protein
MADMMKNDFVVKVLIALIGALFGAILNWIVTEYRRRNDPVGETRRAIERKLAALLGPYTIDSVKSRSDIAKIRQDWTSAFDDYAVTVNGSLADISMLIDQYLSSFLDFIRGDIDRAALEAKRDLANKVTISRVPLIRRRRH